MPLEGKKTGFSNPRWAELVYWLLAALYWEVLLHTAVYGGFRASFGYGIGFTVAAAMAIAAVLSLIPGKAAFVLDLILSLGLIMLYGSQMVYNFIFGTLYSVAAVGQGGDAVTSFWRETLSAMAAHWLWLVLLFVPVILLVCLRKGIKGRGTRGLWLYRTALAALAALTVLGMERILFCNGTGLFSDYDFYHSDTISTNQTAERFGLLTTFRLELVGAGRDETSGEEASEYFIPTGPMETQPEEKAIEYNVMDIDFDKLNAMTGDEKKLAINAYCAQLPGTSKNEYTGLLADYNLIVLCAESFSPAAVDPEITPTLYKLTQEGILFENFYTSFPNTTTDGEYTLMQGLFPDTTRNKNLSSLYTSRDSYLPFTLGNVFSEQRGIQSFGYHNYRGSYYGRDESHPNMGYTMKFAGDGMEFTSAWPASDLEMMEQSVDDYIGEEQFHAYYMTFSGHYQYEASTNTMAKRNWDAVKDLPYSNNTCKAYLSCNIELDKALEYLMKRLEEAGVADHTAIVLTADHFPYGLSDAQYSELVGYQIDDFSKYKSDLIFWVGGLEENITVKEYCSTIDILPTILNLWGFTYDSRMLAGTDVFSDGIHAAVRIDKSWMTDKVWFNANTGEIRYLVDESEVSADYIDTMNRLVATRFSISSDILNTAYYNFVFDKGEVKIGRWGWNHK